MENLRKRTMVNGVSHIPPEAIVSGSQTLACDVVFSTNDGSELAIVRGEENWPDTGWTPIGIVIVPGTHNRYGDNTCGVMSLVSVNGFGFSRSSEVASRAWASNSYASSTSPKTTLVGNSIFSDTTALDSNSNNLCYQSSSTRIETLSKKFWPYSSSNPNINTASTSFSNTNGYVTDITGKACCDFNGIRNTVAGKKFLMIGAWTTLDDFNLTCAFSGAGRYKTVGTSSFYDLYNSVTSNDIKYGTKTSTKTNTKFWYLPACGELCYIPARKVFIDNTIDELNQKYNNVADSLNDDFGYWSSSEKTDTTGWKVLCNGNVSGYLKSNGVEIRPFMRL